MSTRLIAYIREGCHLCEDLTQQLREQLPLRLYQSIEWRDVDSRENWFEQYDQRVPLLFLDGRLIAEYFLEKSAISLILNSHQPVD